MINKLKELISDKIDIKEYNITEETSLLTDLEMSSLDLVNLVVDVEDEFGIEIDERDMSKIRTVKDLIDYIQSKKSSVV